MWISASPRPLPSSSPLPASFSPPARQLKTSQVAPPELRRLQVEGLSGNWIDSSTLLLLASSIFFLFSWGAAGVIIIGARVHACCTNRETKAIQCPTPPPSAWLPQLSFSAPRNGQRDRERREKERDREGKTCRDAVSAQIHASNHTPQPLSCKTILCLPHLFSQDLLLPGLATCALPDRQILLRLRSAANQYSRP